jgi:hypothetical protein
MRVLSSPPIARMKVLREDATGILLTLAGGERLMGGLQTAAGAGFAAYGARFLRLPLPPSLKWVPLGLMVVGAGFGALGLATVIADHRVEVTARGVEIRWRVGPTPHTVTLAREEIEAFEVTPLTRITAAEDGDAPVVAWALQVVSRKGDAYAIEQFGTRTQADLRKRKLQSIIFAD